MFSDVAQVDCVGESICLRKFINDYQSLETVYQIQRIIQAPDARYTRAQFPVVPAFLTTIYKNQSVTIDRIAIYLDNKLTHDQLYVAMSRV